MVPSIYLVIDRSIDWLIEQGGTYISRVLFYSSGEVIVLSAVNDPSNSSPDWFRDCTLFCVRLLSSWLSGKKDSLKKKTAVIKIPIDCYVISEHPW